MTQPYRQRTVQVDYTGWRDEGMLLARTTQRYRGVQTSSLVRGGRARFVSMYGILPTPFSDDLLVSIVNLRLTDRITAAHTASQLTHGH